MSFFIYYGTFSQEKKYKVVQWYNNGNTIVLPSFIWANKLILFFLWTAIYFLFVHFFVVVCMCVLCVWQASNPSICLINFYSMKVLGMVSIYQLMVRIFNVITANHQDILGWMSFDYFKFSRNSLTFASNFKKIWKKHFMDIDQIWYSV